MLFARLMSKTKFYNIPEILFRYRWHNSNTTILQAEKMERATYAIRALMQAEMPVLYNEFMQRATRSIRIRLFGFIPVLKIETRGYKTKLYLFEKLLLLSFKRSAKLQEGQ